MDQIRVVIRGMGAITPLGNDAGIFIKNLCAGVSGADIITRFYPEQCRTRFACVVRHYDPLNYFNRKETVKIDRFCHYGLIAAGEAVRNAGLDLNKTDMDRAGAVESMATRLAVRSKVIPPTINTTHIVESIPSNIDLILGKAVHKEIRYDMGNSFDSGGHCASVILKKYED